MTKVNILQQVPSHVAANYPAFTEFVQAYYDWLTSEYFTNNLETIVDIEQTPQEFIKYFKQQLARDIPEDIHCCPRLFYQRIKDLYTAKGTESAYKLLFRLVYGQETDIVYPSEQILRASDGRWKQEQFITVETTFGALPSIIREFYIQYEFSVKRVAVTRFEIINLDTTRLYYNVFDKVSVSVDTIIQVRNDTGIVEYAGKVVKSPASITVKAGGTNWQLGQVIVIPGSKKNTIARVSKIDANGGILRVEIIDYGYNHTDSQLLTISPYPIKPLGASYDISSQIIGVSPVAYHHTLTINDYTDGTSETTTGSMSGTFIGSYFLEDYASKDYNGDLVFEVVSTQAPTQESQFSDLTLEQWLASRATLILNYSEKATLKGAWVDDRGQVSNEYIRLEDNFFYQQFSYVINSTENPSAYIELAKNIHPVGLKLFTNYNLEQTIQLELAAETSFPFVNIDLIDVAETEEKITGKQIYKLRSDQAVADESHYSLVNKYLTDTVGVVSADTYNISTSTYDAEVYFAEDYTAIITELNLGV